jgi:hypothetical protein
MSKGDSMKIHITITDEKGNSYSGSSDLAKSSGKTKRVIPISKSKTKRPSDVIKDLHQEGFFKEEKKLDETAKKLKSKGFNFGRSSVFMALESAEYLKKNGTKGKYKFIQKYPPS